MVERLLMDLAPLEVRVWLVIDDVHELGPEVLRQLELLVMRAPSQLRFVLASRHDVRLGLHRLRLEGVERLGHQDRGQCEPGCAERHRQRDRHRDVGCSQRGGRLIVCAAQTGAHARLAQITHLVKQAQAGKARAQNGAPLRPVPGPLTEPGLTRPA
jgi:hypothetical protein